MWQNASPTAICGYYSFFKFQSSTEGICLEYREVELAHIMFSLQLIFDESSDEKCYGMILTPRFLVSSANCLSKL